MAPKNAPSAGQWAEQQKIADEKQRQRSKGVSQKDEDQTGGEGEPQSTSLEPEKNGGIGGP